MKSLSLNKEIYRKESIKDVIAVYKDYARMEIKESKDYWIVIFNECVLDENRTVKEFENYLISIENC